MKRSGDYPEKILDPGEEILIHERPHWISLARPTMRAILTVMLVMLLLAIRHSPGGSPPGHSAGCTYPGDGDGAAGVGRHAGLALVGILHRGHQRPRGVPTGSVP